MSKYKPKKVIENSPKSAESLFEPKIVASNEKIAEIKEPSE